MKLARRGLRITLICDRMRSRDRSERFTDRFPDMVGKTLKFHSGTTVEMVGNVALFTWLFDNRYL